MARASRAERPDGKRHDHQRRIAGKALEQVGPRLDGTSWHAFESFFDLHAFLEGRIGTLPEIGELGDGGISLPQGPEPLG